MSNQHGVVGRQFKWPLVVVAVLASLSAGAEPNKKVPRIGYVEPFGSYWNEPVPVFQAFRAGMVEHGLVEGRDYVMELRDAQGKPERYPELTEELVRLPVDLFLVNVCGAPMNAARQATKTIPIVVPTCNDDMVETGLVKSLARPGGNVTGLSKLTPELAAKRLSLLKQTLPRLSKVAVLWNPNYSDFKADWRELRSAAKRLGVTLHPVEFRRPEEYEAAFAAMSAEHVDALITFSDTLTFSFADQVAKRAAAANVPAMFAFREVPDAGGLMSYGPNLRDMWYRCADYVARILKGVNPADMAIEQPERFEFVINVKAAKALGIAIPADVLLQADQIIE